MSGVRHILEMSHMEVYEFEEFRTRWGIVAIAVKLHPFFIIVFLSSFCCSVTVSSVSNESAFAAFSTL